jgi:hypothetical protein
MTMCLVFSQQRSYGLLGLFFLVWSVAGCDPGFKTVPVVGKITLNELPLSNAEATVLFRPNPAKGNTSKLDFSGNADQEGNYKLYHQNGKLGAAPGWYKVAIVVTESAQPKPGDKARSRKPGPGSHIRKSLIDRKYATTENSGLEIEVVENPAPGAYDFHLTEPSAK